MACFYGKDGSVVVVVCVRDVMAWIGNEGVGQGVGQRQWV